MVWRTELDISHNARFACRRCTACCRDRCVPVSPVEQRLIERVEWAAVAPRLTGSPLFELTASGKTSRMATLARVDGDCVFLEGDVRCLLWEELGQEGMPLACRRFPLVFAQEPVSTVVSASFACPSIIDNSGVPLREQAATIKEIYPDERSGASEPGSKGTPAFQVPARIVLCAEIGLDWYSYQAMERLLTELLEDEAHSIGQRLLAIYRLIDAATVIYGNGSRTAPHFKLWIERMAEPPLRKSLFGGDSKVSRRSALRQRARLVPLILSIERWQAAEQGVQHHPATIREAVALLRQRGLVYLHSLKRELDLRSMRQVVFDQDDPRVSGILARYLVECLRRKLLLRRKNLVRGAHHLLACIALVRWYSVAFAASRGASAVEAQDLHASISLVERGYSCNGLAEGESKDEDYRLLTRLLNGLVAPADLAINPYVRLQGSKSV